MTDLWRNSSGDLIRDGGNLVRCATCPCDVCGGCGPIPSGSYTITISGVTVCGCTTLPSGFDVLPEYHVLSSPPTCSSFTSATNLSPSVETKNDCYHYTKTGLSGDACISLSVNGCSGFVESRFRAAEVKMYLILEASVWYLHAIIETSGTSMGFFRGSSSADCDDLTTIPSMTNLNTCGPAVSILGGLDSYNELYTGGTATFSYSP